jgi:hypothetical protein
VLAAEPTVLLTAYVVQPPIGQTLQRPSLTARVVQPLGKMHTDRPPPPCLLQSPRALAVVVQRSLHARKLPSLFHHRACGRVQPYHLERGGGNPVRGTSQSHRACRRGLVLWGWWCSMAPCTSRPPHVCSNTPSQYDPCWCTPTPYSYAPCLAYSPDLLPPHLVTLNPLACRPQPPRCSAKSGPSMSCGAVSETCRSWHRSEGQS